LDDIDRDWLSIAGDRIVLWPGVRSGDTPIQNANTAATGTSGDWRQYSSSNRAARSISASEGKNASSNGGE
jgi:hypothetical protein